MEYTYSDELYSDFHKDTYGVRPGESGFRYWNSLTPAQKQAEWERMGETMRAEQEWEKQQQERAIVEFETAIQAAIDLGAGDRATAIKWQIQAGGWECEYDAGYICYCLGLPYHKGYEEEFQPFIGKPYQEAA